MKAAFPPGQGLFGLDVAVDRTMRIGKYLARRALGAGSFATVWLADDEVLDSQVAVKVLADNWAQHVDVRRRFIEEAKLLRRIDHDRVVRIHDVDEMADGRPYFVMTWADRGTLHDRMQQYAASGTPMSIEEAVRLVIEICECLAVVHAFGVVHRDVKPSNVLFRSVRSHERFAAKRRGTELGDEQMILGDFGLAKDLAAASGFTQAAGTPAYMAPEQARPTALIDHRVDVFGAASVLYELLTGKPPITASTLSGVRRDVDGSAMTPIRAVRPDISPALAAVVGRGLAYLPEQRYDSVIDFATALGEALPAPPPESAEVLLPDGTPSMRGSSLPGSAIAPGAAGRALDVLAMARNRGLASSTDVSRIEEQIVSPLGVTVVSAAASLTVELGALAGVRVSEGVGHIEGSDVLVVRFQGDEATAVSARLRSQKTGPLLTVVLARDTAMATADPTVIALGAEVVPDDAGGHQTLARFVAVANDRRPLVRAAAALNEIEAVLSRAESHPAASDLHDAIDAMRLELPALDELDLLRRDAAAGSPLPSPLRGPVRRLFFFTSPAQRLGLDHPSEAALRDAVVAMLERWKGLSNSGRIPFAARSHAALTERSLERLFLELGQASSF
jgi:serine/threonine protein kinase